MVAFLSPEWLDRTLELLGKLPDGPAASAVSVRVQHVVTGAPGGEVTSHVTYETGRPVAAGLGPDPDAELILTAPHAVAAEIATGELEPAVAFMQGRLKTEGPTSKLTPLLALTQTPAYRSAAALLATETEVAG